MQRQAELALHESVKTGVNRTRSSPRDSRLRIIATAQTTRYLTHVRTRSCGDLNGPGAYVEPRGGISWQGDWALGDCVNAGRTETDVVGDAARIVTSTETCGTRA